MDADGADNADSLPVIVRDIVFPKTSGIPFSVARLSVDDMWRWYRGSLAGTAESRRLGKQSK